ncbi:hypothetical protein P9112_002815 [Eukaryota sp. TZLM1-RC]
MSVFGPSHVQCSKFRCFLRPLTSQAIPNQRCKFLLCIDNHCSKQLTLNLVSCQFLSKVVTTKVNNSTLFRHPSPEPFNEAQYRVLDDLSKIKSSLSQVSDSTFSKLVDYSVTNSPFEHIIFSTSPSIVSSRFTIVPKGSCYFLLDVHIPSQAEPTTGESGLAISVQSDLIVDVVDSSLRRSSITLPVTITSSDCSFDCVFDWNRYSAITITKLSNTEGQNYVRKRIERNDLNWNILNKIKKVVLDGFFFAEIKANSKVVSGSLLKCQILLNNDLHFGLSSIDVNLMSELFSLDNELISKKSLKSQRIAISPLSYILNLNLYIPKHCPSSRKKPRFVLNYYLEFKFIGVEEKTIATAFDIFIENNDFCDGISQEINK